MLTRAERDELKILFRYDKRSDGSRGRALIADVPRPQLRKGDRLEPCPALPDVAGFEALDDFPIMVLFWSLTGQTWTHHRNPLLQEDIGV